jgi:hypothetical protein
MEPHMIDNYVSVVFVIMVNHVGFIVKVLNIFNSTMQHRYSPVIQNLL